jgi:hypothetical protein
MRWPVAKKHTLYKKKILYKYAKARGTNAEGTSISL